MTHPYRSLLCLRADSLPVDFTINALNHHFNHRLHDFIQFVTETVH